MQGPRSFTPVIAFACQQMAVTGNATYVADANLDKSGVNVKHWERNFRQQQTLRSTASQGCETVTNQIFLCSDATRNQRVPSPPS